MNIASSRIDPESINPLSAPVAASSDESTSILRHYVMVALRWRWAILGAVLLCLVVGLVVTFLMTPKYTATATIEISRDADKVTNFQGVERDSNVADQEFYQTQYGLLKARTLAERVALRLRLVDDPAFFAMFSSRESGPAYQIANGRYPVSGRAKRQRDAGQILLDHLSISPTRLSRLVDIDFTSPNPKFSADVANAWAKNFIESNLERKVQATSYGRDQLQRELANYKQRLDESQRQLVQYASTEQIINLPAQTGGNGTTTQERSVVADELAALNEALAAATADRIQAQAQFQSGPKGGSSTEALQNLAINSMRQKRAELAAQYQDMMVRFEPGYPAAQAIKSQLDQLDKSIAREESRISGSIAARYREAVARETALKAKVDSLKNQYLDLRRRSIQYNIYQQEVDTNRQLYDGLLQRFKEIGVAGGVGINNVAIVDSADVPEKASSPRLLLNTILSLLAGAAVGAILALVLEQLDDRIVDPAEVQRRIGLPLLGTVPRVQDELPRDAILDRKSDLVDAYLAVQTSLAFTTSHGIPRSFAVTSTRPAEGKSSTALALATTLARGARRVVLVDGDMRSPSVHHLAGTDHDKGLSNLLAGEENIEAHVIRMADFGIDAITAGPIPPNAAELLTGTRLQQLVARLLESYDHVVIDSPPVMGLADALLIASDVEGVVFAVESHGIRLMQVRTALDRLKNSNAHLLGAVLTKFDARRSHYGYGYEYGYSYGRNDSSEAEA